MVTMGVREQMVKPATVTVLVPDPRTMAGEMM